MARRSFLDRKPISPSHYEVIGKLEWSIRYLCLFVCFFNFKNRKNKDLVVSSQTADILSLSLMSIFSPMALHFLNMKVSFS